MKAARIVVMLGFFVTGTASAAGQGLTAELVDHCRAQFQAPWGATSAAPVTNAWSFDGAGAHSYSGGGEMGYKILYCEIPIASPTKAITVDVEFSSAYAKEAPGPAPPKMIAVYLAKDVLPESSWSSAIAWPPAENYGKFDPANGASYQLSASVQRKNALASIPLFIVLVDGWGNSNSSVTLDVRKVTTEPPFHNP